MSRSSWIWQAFWIYSECRWNNNTGKVENGIMILPRLFCVIIAVEICKITCDAWSTVVSEIITRYVYFPRGYDWLRIMSWKENTKLFKTDISCIYCFQFLISWYLNLVTPEMWFCHKLCLLMFSNILSSLFYSLFNINNKWNLW